MKPVSLSKNTVFSALKPVSYKNRQAAEDPLMVYEISAEHPLGSPPSALSGVEN
jgi:hypothetical protein